MMIAVVFEVTAQQMPKACSELLAVLRSIDRIEEFLQAPEINTLNYTHHTGDPAENIYAVKINSGDFFIRPE
jgi:hypothetical protein